MHAVRRMWSVESSTQKNFKEASRKTSKNRNKNLDIIFLKKQSGAPPPSSALSGQRDLSSCHHWNIHQSVVELDLWHLHCSSSLTIKNLLDTPAQDSNTENKTPPPHQPGDDVYFCHRTMTTKRESVEQSSENKQGARELEP